MKTTNEMRVGDLVTWYESEGPQLLVSIEDDGRWYGTQMQFYGWRDEYGTCLSYYIDKDIVYEDAHPYLSKTMEGGMEHKCSSMGGGTSMVRVLVIT